jgi:hypothetical protein
LVENAVAMGQRRMFVRWGFGARNPNAAEERSRIISIVVVVVLLLRRIIMLTSHYLG